MVQAVKIVKGKEKPIFTTGEDLPNEIAHMTPMFNNKFLPDVDGFKSGKFSYSEEKRTEIFNFIINEIKKYSDCKIALCKESANVWKEVGLDASKNNCVCQFGHVNMLDNADAILRRAEKECNRNEEKFKAYFSDTVNIRSSKSIMEVSNNHPEMRVKEITLKNTEKTTLKKYVKIFPILQSVLDYRFAKVFVNAASQVLRFINIDTDRVYTFYDPLGGVTGRFSSNSPAFQGMPKSKEFRACFIAGKGKKFVIADYSQIELRILAEISGDIRMINAFVDGIDFHSLTAAIISRKRISDIVPSERAAAKAINFGIAFGMGPAGLVTYALDNYDVELTLTEAKNFQRDFFNEYRGLAEWSQKQVTMKSRITRTIGGRIRRWKGNRVSSTELLNTPIQGTAADVLKYALWILSDRLTELDALLVGCVHDEIILEVGENNADYVAEELARVMEDAGSWYLKRVPVVVDVKIDDHWS